DKVTVYLSKGEETKTTTVPKLLGKTEARAKQELTDAKLSVGSVTQDYSDDYEEGEVMSQTIQGGSTVEEGTEVGFVVSRGKKDTTVALPDVLGWSEADAIARITQAGLVPSPQYVFSDTVAEGVVAEMEHDPGRKLEAGTSVEIYVSKGPRPTEAPTTQAPTEPEPVDPGPENPAPENPEPTQAPADPNGGGENLPDVQL
ncbi:MAG: PASTA domain-containing protein, partial [Lachnospiraceae bacterium]|nr:PASTA domain-containing protein [Lachnospiraceae bacterium]